MQIEGVEAIPSGMPVKKVFSGSGYRDQPQHDRHPNPHRGRAHERGLHRDNRAQGGEIERIIASSAG